MITKEMTELTSTRDVVDARELTVAELDAATGGTLPAGFMKAVWMGVVAGFAEAGGQVYLTNHTL